MHVRVRQRRMREGANLTKPQERALDAVNKMSVTRTRTRTWMMDIKAKMSGKGGDAEHNDDDGRLRTR